MHTRICSVPVTDPKVSILRQFAPATGRRDRGTDRQLGAFITTPAVAGAATMSFARPARLSCIGITDEFRISSIVVWISENNYSHSLRLGQVRRQVDRRLYNNGLNFICDLFFPGSN